MKPKGYIPDHLKDKEYFAGKAGSFSGVPLRTVQTWTEKELVKPDKGTEGTGDKRKYSALNCIEIGIIKSLADDRMNLKHIKMIMSRLREPYQFPLMPGDINPSVDSLPAKNGLKKAGLTNLEGFLEGIVEGEEAYLILQYVGDEKTKGTRPNILFSPFPEEGFMDDESQNMEKTIIINLRKIAAKILAKMS
jgi:DNA-binding transcriptional MerR regulator